MHNIAKYTSTTQDKEPKTKQVSGGAIKPPNREL
jgi:hypothetical protein